MEVHRGAIGGEEMGLIAGGAQLSGICVVFQVPD